MWSRGFTFGKDIKVRVEEEWGLGIGMPLVVTRIMQVPNVNPHASHLNGCHLQVVLCGKAEFSWLVTSGGVAI